MKCSKEYKDFLKWLRSMYGKKNGVLPGYAMDHPKMEKKADNKKRIAPRKLKRHFTDV